MPISRRHLFAQLIAPLQAGARVWGDPTSSPADISAPQSPDSPGSPAPTNSGGAKMVAVIMGRHCLAYQNSFCSTCLERCPIPAAISRVEGLPRVNPDACTGCGICVDLCPAATPAIRILPCRSRN